MGGRLLEEEVEVSRHVCPSVEFAIVYRRERVRLALTWRESSDHQRGSLARWPPGNSTECKQCQFADQISYWDSHMISPHSVSFRSCRVLQA